MSRPPTPTNNYLQYFTTHCTAGTHQIKDGHAYNLYHRCDMSELTVDPVCCSHCCYSTRCESIYSTQFAARCCHHRPQQQIMSWGRTPSCCRKNQVVLVLRKCRFHHNSSARSDSISDQHPSVRDSRSHRSTSIRDIDHLNEAKQFVVVLYSTL